MIAISPFDRLEEGLCAYVLSENRTREKLYWLFRRGLTFQEKAGIEKYGWNPLLRDCLSEYFRMPVRLTQRRLRWLCGILRHILELIHTKRAMSFSESAEISMRIGRKRFGRIRMRSSLKRRKI